MKIGVLTFQYAHNYGALLQAFALMSVLNKMEVTPVMIDRFPNTYQEPSFKWKLITTLKGGDIFKKFKKKYLTPITDAYYSSGDMNKLNEQNFQMIIVGSDQIWRYENTDVGYNYFLDFVTNPKIRKVSYATSFGLEDWTASEAILNAIAKCLETFDAISVREDAGVLICKNLLGASAVHVLDPTLLLDKSAYFALLPIGNEFDRNNGITTYILDVNDRKRNIITEVSRCLNEKVYNLMPLKDCKSRMDLLLNKDKSVIEWVKHIAHANFVVTDSFHGMVFSILFNKQFLVIGNKERGMSRFDSLLGLLGLKNRLCYDLSGSVATCLYPKINYREVNAKLELAKLSSLSFLKQAIDNAR